jgi:hypothetical protein
MEEALRQFYHEARRGGKPEALLLTPKELALKAVITRCIQALTEAQESELAHLVQVFRAEGLQISEPSIRQEKFVAAAMTLTFEPLTHMFGKL